MALDFSNRNPSDPNGIYSLDTTGAATAWVKDGDWSQIYYSEGEARKAGATNKVRIATAITNDGRKFDVLVGDKGQAISEVGDSVGTDPDQQRRWKDQQAAANKPPEERNNNGRRERWNPQASKWEDVGPAISTTATPTDPNDPDAKNKAELQRQREKNAALPPEQDPAYETDAERRKRAQDRIDQQGKDAEAARNRQRQDEADARARQQANQPRVTLTGDGTQAVIVSPDGSVRTVPTGVQGKPDRVTLEGRIYERQPDGSYADKTPPGPQMPSDLPRFSPDWSKPGLGTTEYAAAIRARNDLTDKQKTDLIGDAKASADSAVSMAQGVITAQQNVAQLGTSERGQDVSRATSALSNGLSASNNATKTALDATRYSSGAGVAAAIAGGEARAVNMAQLLGGTREIPRTPMGPAVAQVNAQTIPGMAGGGVPSMSTLLAPAAGPVAPAPAAGPAAPIFRPMPPAAYPGAPAPAAAAPAMAPPAAAPVQQQAPAMPNPDTVMPPGSAAANPPPLVTPPPVTMAPGQPQGMAALLAPPPQMQGQQQPGMSPMALQLGGAMGGYDPTRLNRELLEDGFDPDVVALLGGAGLG